MSFRSILITAGALAVSQFFGLSSAIAEIVVLPSEIQLNSRGAVHGLIVETVADQRFKGDVTAHTAFESSDPKVVTVNDKGVLSAVGNGSATITAKSGSESATATVTVVGADVPVVKSFRNQVQPVLFKAGCNSGACHGAAAGKNGFRLSLRGFNDEADHTALTRQASARRVSLAEPDQSLILLKASNQVPHEGGKRFDKDSEAYNIIADWIRAGAPPAKEDDARVERLEVFPPALTLTEAAKQQILVRAHYSNGTYDDVTRFVKFATTDESVAQIDELGMISVQGPGAAALTVWYASKVSSVKLTVPRATPLPATVFANAERKNFVDDLVLKQLESLQIAPTKGVSDTEFVRRAYLDATGSLPTETEIFAFVMDSSADKRALLVDRLLDSPKFVDYWAYKWSDLLLLSSRNIPKKEELNAFYQFIRNSVAVNKPWDVFVREIITAKGSTIENGATNYFAMHKETVDVTETTSQAFLGMSVTCARCHNHPLEKWTMDDYYGMANLFSRVKIKGGQRGDSLVLAQNFGNILHPRLGAPVAPKPLDGVAISIDDTTDRRESLAQWLTAPENPYFTRSVVNRVWKNFMGRGLVEPEDDLRLTNPATNDDLMNALADDLAANKYDLKHLMRVIMNSATYQRSSEPSDVNAPDKKYYSQYIIRRLNAEVILDAYSQVTKVATDFAGYPKGFGALQLPDSQVGSYFLAAFGRPNRVQTCSCERTSDSNVAQTLHVANGDTLNNKIRNENSVVSELVTKSNERALDEIYLRALSRYPNDKERSEALALLASVPAEGPERREAFEDLTWSVLSGKEFLFNH